MSIRILRPGLLMTVQDLGRHGHQHVGLCPGGAMDPMSLKLANALVKNDVGAAALELTVLGPDLEFERDTLIALVGAEFETDFPINRPVLVQKGSHISISRAARGARGYLAVAGGIAVEPVLGSRSTYLPGGFGGVEGRVLKRGDSIPLAENSEQLSQERFQALKHKRGNSVRWHVPSITVPDREPIVLHALEGEHFGDFDANMQRAFFDTVWRVTPDSNRMGYRLAGPPITRSKKDEILSAPTCLGTVQVPANGVPIALMADHQTTGGYPRIAEIASADVPRLAQIAPGGTLHFARCGLDMAAELRKDMRERIEGVLHGISGEYGK
ncbi:MAG TPA: biotin-dependent carboxyltransferase family protein [Burkholderiales bacterium]|nr:biotin-dependent carboxyltransferase family protein [Burkholderiales bacterium]